MIATLPDVPGMASTSQAFRRALIAMAERLRMDPDALAAVMSFETAHTFDPAKRNPLSGATGLIQFTHGTAARLGTSTEELARMSAVTQLGYVERYLKPAAGQLATVADHYMAVFAPKGIGQPPSFPLYSEPSIAYEQNQALDRTGDGVITKIEAAAPVLQLLEGAQDRRVDVRSAVPAIAATVVLLGAAGLAWWLS